MPGMLWPSPSGVFLDIDLTEGQRKRQVREEWIHSTTLVHTLVHTTLSSTPDLLSLQKSSGPKAYPRVLQASAWAPPAPSNRVLRTA